MAEDAPPATSHSELAIGPDGRPPVRALGLALLAALLLWQLPYGGIVLYPIKIVATWMHEVSHGVVMMISGAGFDRMEVFPDGSGIAYSAEGSGALRRAFIASAGYMGTPVWGAALLVVGQTVRGARRALAFVGVALVACAALVLANEWGQGVLAVCGAGFVVAAVLLPDRWAVATTNLVAAQAIVTAVLDVRVLFRPVMMVNGKVVGGSDATNMAYATFGTEASWAVWFWAAVWLVWSLGVLALALWWVRRHRPTAAPAQ